MFTLGNVDDREPLRLGKLLENIKGKLCADKGYIGQALFENLFLNGIQLVTKVKKQQYEEFTDEYCRQNSTQPKRNCVLLENNPYSHEPHQTQTEF